MKKLEQLPRGPEWICDILEIKGDQTDVDGNYVTQEVELWRRDPVECIRELIGNPLFRDKLRYEPQLKFLDEEGKVRVYDEMWTGDWWWNTQVSIDVRRHNVLFASVVTSVDQLLICDRKNFRREQRSPLLSYLQTKPG